MKTQASFIRADSAVHLDTKSAVNLEFALIINPWNAERDDALRLCHALKNFCLLIFRMGLDKRHHRHSHFMHCLVKLWLARVALLNLLHELFNFFLYRR